MVGVRLRVVPHFSSGIVERAKRERAWKSPHARKGDTWGDFHARSRFERSSIPKEKWGTTRSLGRYARQFKIGSQLRFFSAKGRTAPEANRFN